MPSVISIFAGIGRHLRRNVLRGLLLLLPIGLTYLIFRLLFNWVDPLLRPAVEAFLDFGAPGSGILALVVIAYLVGLVGANLIGRHVVRAAQKCVVRIPIVGPVYSASKQIVDTLSGEGPRGFSQVVLVEYPRSGCWTLGFTTGSTTHSRLGPLVSVFLPTAPTPTSGWIALVPSADVHPVDITVQEAMRWVVSGGILTPSDMNELLPREGDRGVASA